MSRVTVGALLGREAERAAVDALIERVRGGWDQLCAVRCWFVALAIVGLGLIAGSGCASRSSAVHGWHSRAPTYVVFDRKQKRGPNHDIYIANAAGSRERRLTSWAGDEQSPRFSPDGKKIVFRVAAGPEIAPDIWVMNRDGSGKHDLTRTPSRTEWSPTWTPDGRHIVFSCAPPNQVGAVGNDLCVMNPDGSHRRYLIRTFNSSEEYPTFDPSGRRFAYVYYDATGYFELWTADANGSDRRSLTPPRVMETWPSWSPDGRKIAFKRDAGRGDIWVMRPDGSGKRNLTNTPDLDEQFPAWLPDGRLSFVRGDGRRESSYALWVMNADGADQHELIDHVSGWADWAAAP
jgi:TolB protein